MSKWDALRGPSLSALVKLGSFPFVAAAWVLAGRIVVEHTDAGGYAAYMLVAGIAALLPFADLGLGAAVMDAFARRNAPDAVEPENVLVASLRWLSLAGMALASAGLLVGMLGGWTVMLGLSPDKEINLFIGLCVALFGLGLPFSIGPRILTGIGKNHIAVVFQAVSALTMLSIVYLASSMSPRLAPLMLAPYSGVLLANLAALGLALRLTGLKGSALARGLLARRGPRASLRGVAGPMLIISITLPMAYQTDRIILSHFTDLVAVAEYSIVFQVFSPMLGVLGSAGVALWPFFARQRTRGLLDGSTVVTSVAAFTTVGALMAAVVVGAGPPVADFISAGSVPVTTGLTLSFALLLVVQAISYPLAMALTSPCELRIQAFLHLAMLSLNLPMSVFLAARLGAKGPVLASVVAIVMMLLLPQIVRARRLTRQF